MVSEHDDGWPRPGDDEDFLPLLPWGAMSSDEDWHRDIEMPSTPGVRGGDYSEHELQALVDNFLTLTALRHVLRPAIHVRLMDLEVAVWHLPRKLRDVMIVYGLLRFQARVAGEALHISHTAVTKRYRQGFESMLYRLNGEQ